MNHTALRNYFLGPIYVLAFVRTFAFKTGLNLQRLEYIYSIFTRALYFSLCFGLCFLCCLSLCANDGVQLLIVKFLLPFIVTCVPLVTCFDLHRCLRKHFTRFFFYFYYHNLFYILKQFFNLTEL